MATVSAKIYSHHTRNDGTFNVKICVYHKGDRKFFDTNHFLAAKQLTPEFKIKDKFILRIIDDELQDYRKTISELGIKLNLLSCEALRDYLEAKDKAIDFIAFGRKHISQMLIEKRKGSAHNFNTVINSLCDYFRRPSVPIEEINSNMLFSYEKYLKSTRKIVRPGQNGQDVETTEKGLSKGGLYNHMRDLRTIFNEARRCYNNIDFGLIVIKHYPFETYKLGSAPKTQKRCHTIEQVRKIRDSKPVPGSRAELARDLYMLSFYMCGANAVDIYNHLDLITPKSTRWDYNRSKTAEIREDNAFISVKIIPEAKKIIRKYLGKLKKRYCSHGGLDTALYHGFKALQKLTGIKATEYWARHSFANIARNKCGVTKDDIQEALNHVDEEHRTTDIYLDRDWNIIDVVQEKVRIALAGKSDSEVLVENRLINETDDRVDHYVNDEPRNDRQIPLNDKAEILRYLQEIGYQKKQHPNFAEYFKYVKAICDYELSVIEVYGDGALQIIGLPIAVKSEKLAYWKENETTFDTLIIHPTLSELKIIENVMTRSRVL
ncbi:recombinase [Pedobacter hiemivivus]|uniref:Recombinase n=1 Tax=Pedobacter hiemivivus TaxID=2530454 RepID=A0A4U1GH06_9SPHI|nr:site-specific integrase [Pedobacter hiemivivus]TKC62419.1 recombinase [Pedobacter hiemivivus]